MTKRFDDGDTFTHNGREFKVTFPCDCDCDAPWEREDGHGPVRAVRGSGGRIAKEAGERILYDGRDGGYVYDWAEAIKIAKRDGWGMSREDRIKFAWKHWRCPTKGEIAAHAVQQDYDRLRRWLNDDWCYVGVVVECDDELHGVHDASLWGIESDAEDYLTEVAYELADQINDQLDELDALDDGIAKKMRG